MNSTAASRMEQCNGQQSECAAVEDQPAQACHRADAELIRRFVDQQDEAAFRQIVHRYTPLVMSVALRTTRDRQAAEDVLQATFLVLVEKAESLDDPTQIAAWLHGVAMRIARRLVDKRHRHKEHPHRHENLVMDPADATDPFEQVCQTRDHDVLGEELQRLPDKLRTPMVLRYLEDLTNEQVAERLGLSVPAVEGRLKRGKKELRRRLARRGVTLGAAMLVWNMTQQALAAAPVANLTDLAATTALAWQSPTPAMAPPTDAAISLAQQEITLMSTLKLTTAGTIAGTVLLASGLLVAMSGADVGPAPLAAAATATSPSLPIDTAVNSETDVTVALAQSDDTAATDEARTDLSSSGEVTSIEDVVSTDEAVGSSPEVLYATDATDVPPIDEVSENSGTEKAGEVTPFIPIDQPEPSEFHTPKPTGERRERALELLTLARQSLKTGDVETACRLVIQAASINATYTLDDDRPELVLIDIVASGASTDVESASESEDAASTDATGVPTEFLDTGQVDITDAAAEAGTTDIGADIDHGIETVLSYALKSVDAQAMVRVLEALYPGSSTRGHETGLSVADDADTNRLLVRGTPQQHEEIRKLLKTIDDPELQLIPKLPPVRQHLPEPVLKDIAGQLANKEITFEKPDGVIRNVDNATHTVWLNLGEKDSIKPQVSFGVYDQDHAGGPRNVKDSKGSIEIVRVLGPHLSEARINTENIERPFKPGDVVYSPLWTTSQNANLSQATTDDTAPADSAADLTKEINVFPLQQVSAESAVQMIRDLAAVDAQIAGGGGDEPPVFSHDVRSNSVLIFGGDPDYIKMLESLLQRIDGAVASDGAATFLESDPTVTEVPDEVPEDASEIAGDVVTPEPTPESSEPIREVRVFKLESLDAKEMAEAFAPLVEKSVAVATTYDYPYQPPEVTFDARTNSVIVKGSTGQLELVDALLTRWDVQTARWKYAKQKVDDVEAEADAVEASAQQQKQSPYIVLEHAAPRQVARLIAAVFPQALEGDSPAVTVDEQNGMLIVRGTDEVAESIRWIAVHLDHPRPEDQDSPSAQYMQDDVQLLPRLDEPVPQGAPDSAADAPTEDASLSRFDITHRSPAEQKIRQSLRAPTTMEVVELPIRDALTLLADSHSFQFYIDQTSLDDLAISVDEETATLDVADLPVMAVLELLFRQVHAGVAYPEDGSRLYDFGFSALTYFVRDDVLVITTRDVAEQTMQVRTYDLRPFQARGRSNYRDSIVEAIRTMTGESTWDEQGGRGTLVEAFGTLTIRQSPLVHREIEALLQQLLHAAEATAEPE